MIGFQTRGLKRIERWKGSRECTQAGIGINPTHIICGAKHIAEKRELSSRQLGRDTLPAMNIGKGGLLPFVIKRLKHAQPEIEKTAVKPASRWPAARSISLRS